jgi:Domain of unknown function (DUF1924)
MNRRFIGITALLIAIPFYVQADAISELENRYQSQGAGPFSAEAGEILWNKTFVDKKSSKIRNCATCHTSDLTNQGKHARTSKVIEPMATSVNQKRFTNIKKIKKWFVRNCKWTLGRECSAQEKGDFLAFFKNH